MRHGISIFLVLTALTATTHAHVVLEQSQAEAERPQRLGRGACRRTEPARPEGARLVARRAPGRACGLGSAPALRGAR